MSLLPLLMNLHWDAHDHPWELRRHQNRLRSDWDSFGLGLTPEEIQIMSKLPSVRNALQQQHHHQDNNSDNQLLVQGQPQVGKDGFQVLLDVQQFRPNEISVKTVDNNVIVEAKHEERQDEHGIISRQFRRKYLLPKNYDAKDLVSTLSSDGVLTIKVPPPKSSSGSNERIIQIQQTGPAHVNVKDNSVDRDGNKPTTANKKNGN